MNREDREIMKAMLTIMDDPQFHWTPFAHLLYDKIEDSLKQECCEDDIISGGECV